MSDERFRPTASQIAAFTRQLQEHGRAALMRSRASLSRRLAEHSEKRILIVESGGNPASVVREIENFHRQLNAIDEVLGDMR